MIMDDVSAAFRLVEWLKANGATFPKLEWPSYATVSGVRGVVAREAIAPGEKMLCVPEKLMITPPLAEASSELGAIYRSCLGIFATDVPGRDDYVLCLYLMWHMLAPDSFWRPYLDALPEPSSCCDWSEDELRALHDGMLETEAREHVAELHEEYELLMTPLCAQYPERFALERYTFALFKKAWMTVQARAFGRRLEHTALVPLADLLNHANVPVVYDFDAESNGMFRLFPTERSVGYAKGAEVFNSYGRRDNAHLLINYGFAMLHNEHECVSLRLPRSALKSRRHLELAARAGVGYRCACELRRGAVCPALLAFFRTAVLTPDEVGARLLAGGAAVEGGAVLLGTTPLRATQESEAMRLACAYLQDAVDAMRAVVSTATETQVAAAERSRSDCEAAAAPAAGEGREGTADFRRAMAERYHCTRQRIFEDQLARVVKLREASRS
jgi:hypothetical protein